jgi:hypothetical protein
MRFTFVILLFLSLGADAQMIIKAHPNYMPLSQFSGLLDNYSGAAAAYSLRKLDKDYTGNAIRVRRSNDNSEQDIGFTSSGDLDTASLKTFTGANSAFVVTWYNQADSAGVFGIRNATQATAANQPRIVNAGTVERLNNKVVLKFLLNNSIRINYFDISQSWYVFSAVKPSTVSTQQELLVQTSGGGNIGRIYLGFGRSSRQFLTWYNAYLSNSTNALTTNQQLLTYFKTGTTSNWSYGYFTNGAANGSFTNINNSPAVNTTINIGSTFFSPNSIDLSEIIIYTSNESSNRTGIETNINNYYGIY